jgi:CubicO group peptidase (beta-lactamase class C family)
MNILGHVQPGYERLKESFAEGQKNDPGGAQLCVYRHGKEIASLATGRDTVRDRPYTEQTLSVIMSCSKGVTATAAHRLVEREQIDVDAPVARYWPEFASAGKSDVRVHHLLSHSSGLMGFGPELGVEVRDLLDWSRCTRALEAMAPLWPPGTATAYHAITYGYLVGEIIRRVSGKTPGRFVADEIAGPLKLDLWIGLPAREEDRVAPQVSARPDGTVEQITALFKGLGMDLEDRTVRTLMAAVASMGEAQTLLNSPAGHAAEIPAGNGVANARSLARMYAATIGDVDGARLLNKETIERARKPRTDNLPPPPALAKLPPAPRFGLGYELSRMVVPMLGEGSFGHAGAGGRLGFAHPESGIAVAYVSSRMDWDGISGPDARWVPWLAALTEIARQ